MIPKNFKYGSSYSSDFITLTLLVVGLALITGILLAHEAYKLHRENILKTLESESLRIDRKMILEMDNAIYLTESIGRQIGSFSLSQKRIMNLFEAFIPGSEREDGFFWVDKKDMLVMGGKFGILDEPIDVSDRRYVQYSRKTPWQVYVGDPIRGKLTRTQRIPVTMGITDNYGNYLGTLIYSKSLAHLKDEIEDSKANKNVDFLVVDQKLDVLIGDPQKFMLKDRASIEKITNIDYRNTLGNKLINSDLVDIISDRAVYSVFEYSSKYPYITILSYQESTADFFNNSSMFTRFLQVVTITLVILITLLQVRQRVLIPVKYLNEAARKIIKGERYLPKDHSGPKEVEELAKSLRKISDIVQEKKIIEEQNKRKINVLMDKFALDEQDEQKEN